MLVIMLYDYYALPQSNDVGLKDMTLKPKT